MTLDFRNISIFMELGTFTMAFLKDVEEVCLLAIQKILWQGLAVKKVLLCVKEITEIKR